MRIGIDASFLRKPGTGIGQVTVHFLEALKEVSSSDPHEFFLYTEEAPKDASKYPDSFHIKSFLPWWKRDDLIRKVLWEKQVTREAKKDGCEIFLSLYQSSAVAPRGMRHVMVVHDIIPRIFPEYQGNMRQKCHWKLVERGIRRADHVIAVSSSTANDLVEFGIDRDVITIVSPDVAPIFRRDLAPEEENRVMATYALVPGYIYHGGGLEIRKNTAGLLRAYKLLVEKEKSGKLGMTLPMLVISGKIFAESNPLATPVKKLLQELGLGDRVKLLDFVSEQDLPALYKNASFFAYPSFYEGFGLPVLEALSMKTPVLTSDNSSLPEVALDAALYIDPGQVDSIASGMERLLSDDVLRKTLSEKAVEATTRFSWRDFTKTVLDSLS
jgi:glycosyltransferase involved in cell wall biosynthesis